MIILFLSWQRYDFFLNLSLKYQIIYKGNTNQQRSNPFQEEYKHSKKWCAKCSMIGNLALENFSIEAPARKYTSEQTSQRHQHIGGNHIEEVETSTPAQADNRCHHSHRGRDRCSQATRTFMMLLEILGDNLVECDSRGQCCQGYKQEEHRRPQLRCRHTTEYKWERFENKCRALRRFQALNTEHSRENNQTRQYRHQESEHRR